MGSFHARRPLCVGMRYRGIALFAGIVLQLLLAPRSSPQTTAQQRVYGAASTTTTTAVLPAYNKDSTTGALTLLPGAPFADRLEGGQVAIDGQGHFLFVLNPVSDNISMFQIDGSTGALTEVPNSPFAAGPTVNPNVAPSSPVSLAAEKSGQFLYVGYANGDSGATAALVPFAIDAASLRLALTAQLSLDFGNGAPVQMLADPKGLRLYVGLGPGGNQSSSSAGTAVYSIDSASGVLTPTGSAGGGTDFGRSIAIDPQGRFFFDGWGQSQGFLDSGVISPVDGTSTVSSTLNLGAGVFPSVLLVDSSGKFLYVQTGAGLLIYSIDGASGTLTLLNGPVASFSFAKGKVAADPMGPYVYALGNSGVDVFQIDPTTGNLTEIPGAPFSTGASGAVGSLGLAISGSPIQAVSGPAAQVFPSSADFGQVTVGQTSTTKIVSLVNVGNQTLAISGIGVTGANAGDFAQSSTCGATIALNAHCSVSILFTPSQAGAEQASLQVTDNAPGSPQAAALTGTGLATQPSVTISPASANFGTIQPAAIAPPQTVTITNSGTASLHVSGVALSGANTGDFSQTSTCLAAPIAVQASCTITVNFTPQAGGLRTASLVLTDDAANSPQSIALTGTYIAGQGSAAINPGSLNFGTIAQGAAPPPQAVAVTNTGTSALHISKIALTGANSGDFSQTNNCLATALGVQSTCTITVNFAPQALGSRTASIVVTDDAANSPQSISLSGNTVAAFQLSIPSGSAAAATVTAGQTAQYSLQLTPGPSFAGNVMLSCTGAPVAATCNVNPTSLTVSGSSVAAFQVSVATMANGFAPPRMDRPRFWTRPLPVLWVAWAMLLVFLAGQFRRTRLGTIVRAAVFSGVLAIAAAGCGGGSSATPPAPQVRTGTPQGTSTITITAQSGTLSSQTLQLTLTVN